MAKRPKRKVPGESIRRRRPYFQCHKGWYNMGFYSSKTRKTKWIALATNDQEEAQERYWQIYERYERGEFDPHRDRFRAPVTLSKAIELYLNHFDRLRQSQRRKASTAKERRSTLGLFERQLPPTSF